MSRGVKPTTRRSPTQGGREVHVRLSAEEYARLKATAEAEGVTVPAYVRGCLLLQVSRYRDHLPAVMAATEPVELDRPMVMAEAVEERSCWTCGHDRLEDGALAHWCSAENPLDPRIGDYVAESGAIGSDNLMPTNRSIVCPGWAPKEPT